MKDKIILFMCFVFIMNNSDAQQSIKHNKNIKLLYSNVPNQFIDRTGNKNLGYFKIDANYGITDGIYMGAFFGIILIKQPEFVEDRKVFNIPNFGVNFNKILIPSIFKSFDANLYGAAKLGVYLNAGDIPSLDGAGVMGALGIGSIIKICDPVSFVIQCDFDFGNHSEIFGLNINLGISITL